VFRRRKAPDPPVDSDDAAAPRPGAKGRPTPKRREAEKQRRASARVPKNRKEAARQARAKAREQRLRNRQGLLSGDERYLPARDRGPIRGFTRDFVDARRSVAEFFLPAALIVFLLNFVRSPRLLFFVTLFWLVMILAMIIDSTLMVRRLKARLRDRYPGAELRGVGPYSLMRSTQIRRLRLPKPRVKPGTKL
jgi:Protein of unknown function (DUF3043)